MVAQGPFFSFVNEETACLNWFEEFMRKRCLVLFFFFCVCVGGEGKCFMHLKVPGSLAASIA